MSLDSLPSGWSEISTFDTFKQVSTNTKKVKSKECKPAGKFPVIDQGQLDVAGFVDDISKVISVERPLVIFGDHTRIIKWVNRDFVPGADGTKLLEAAAFLEPRYFYYQLKSIELPDKGYSRHFRYLNETAFRVAPLAEQQQIAAKLDELLTQVDILKTRLDTIPKILKRFRQSVLAAAVSGKLTEDWRNESQSGEFSANLLDRWLRKRREFFFEDQEKLISTGKTKHARKFKEPSEPDLETRPVSFPNTWEIVSVSQFADCLDHIRIPVKKDDRENSEGLYPYFGANGEVDRIDEYLFDDDIVLVTEDETFYGREKPIAYRYSGKCWVNNHAHVLRAPTKDANEFLCYTLMYYNVIPWLSGTTGRAKLTQAALNSLPMGLPSEEEQTKIVNQVEQLFTFADQVEQHVKDAQARVNHLTQSILAKAFRGELTAEWREQNPNLISGENSAEALLAKIRAER
jgi:type I restriction enzyme S subunit